MEFRNVCGYLGQLLGLISLLLLAPLGLAIYDGPVKTITAYATTAGLFAALGLLVKRFSIDKTLGINRKETLLVVCLIWILLGLGGALPFYLERSIPEFSGAIFESISGFTTTGATVIADVDHLSRATNLWRCLSHWIGGMGIVVLFVAIFPQVGVSGKQFFKNESAGPLSSSVSPKIRETALTLWWAYALLTALCIGLLKFFGMNWFDAICHGFSTLGTGGFSTKSASIGYYKSPAIEWVISAFMLVAGLNFALLYTAVKTLGRSLFKSAELRLFLAINAVVAAIICVSAYDFQLTFEHNLRSALFQTLAVTSTTGFMTADFDLYPSYCKFLLFLCMFIGGCAGSTAGGLKVVRILLIMKIIKREIKQYIFPQKIMAIRLDGQGISSAIVQSTAVYIAAFILLFFVSSFTVTLAGYSFVDAMSAVIACLASIGPGFDKFGPSQNFGHAPGWVKLILSFCMVAGRLEIIVLLAPFSRSFWIR